MKIFLFSFFCKCRFIWVLKVLILFLRVFGILFLSLFF